MNRGEDARSERSETALNATESASGGLAGVTGAETGAEGGAESGWAAVQPAAFAEAWERHQQERERRVGFTRDQLADALQAAWNDWCGDTGSVPLGLEVRGPRTTRVYARFRDHGFVDDVLARLDGLVK